MNCVRSSIGQVVLQGELVHRINGIKGIRLWSKS